MPGRDKSYYLDRGPDYFPRLKEQLAGITRTHGGRVPDLLELDPSELTEMFDMAKEIKGTDSPVFASKLCHFMLPSAFPVTDNTMLGRWGRDYWAYWQRCADGWRGCPDRELLKRELGKRIPGGAAPCYPWGTKIGELCHWGARPG